ncbi:ATP synthase F0 subunit A [Candidatus Uhrbacteria bacterium RIFCSPHIGHO2_12_FULL_47_11]|nr:MAG: ATP synthase F0 subunit A [Candidatus Uhrbacteria bacterium RIFCSPHIGHO2_12_FULL_47_11]OGL84777.1 MAG: ATP synthase F0 subunit A [Candidatus Uhrbacteria bacterium RIFCSPLOWO2_02_FULL_46_25]OGL93440.1 MAG: ATP synthase F0 subunit A [Candidatus Uhrbacteria bacterium RIFCSPLOWO2_12_FULL_47_10]
MNISLAAEPLFHIGTFPFTNTLIMAWVVIAVILLLVFLIRRKFSMIPKGLQNFFESIFEFALNMMDSVTGNRALSYKFFPVVMTIFIFVFFSNLIEIVPGLGTIGLWEAHEGKTILVPFIRSSSADLNVTLAIALVSVLATQILGIAALGFFKYAGKFIVPPWKSPYVVGTFVGLLELVAEVAKIVSFSFRLFGNIFAGEVLLTVALFLVPYIVPLPFLFLEIFVGLVQAVVFSMLTLVFMKMAVTEHEEHAH